jgi:Ca2+-binding EF-hand superfamily protein
MVWTKISQQWKLLIKAYLEISGSQNGISPAKLRSYLKSWDIGMTDSQFENLFAKFDLDKDGIVSYADFLGASTSG